MKASMLKKCAFFDGKSTEYMFDSLTGVLNRDVMKQYINYLIENEIQFSLCVGDLDNFKNINDKYGHMIGDQVLAQFANRLVSAVGDKTVVGRYGGDEFLIVYEGVTDYKEVWDLCHLINKKLSDVEFANIPGLLVTVTTGVSRFPADGQTYDELLKTADKALYRGKTKGRNCFIVYMAEKHANITHDRNQENIYNTIDMHARIFTILRKRGQPLFDNINYLLRFLSNALMIDHICIQDMDHISHSIVHPLSNVKEFDYIPTNILINAANTNGLFYVSQRKSLLQINYTELHDHLKNQEIRSCMSCIIQSENKKYGVLRFDSSGKQRLWQTYEMDLLVTAANAIGLILDLTGKSIKDVKRN